MGVERLDLLVHPFYEIGKLQLRGQVNGETGWNVRGFWKVWTAAVAEVAADPHWALVLLQKPAGNCAVDLELRRVYNPFRGLGAELAEYAQGLLQERLVPVPGSLKQHPPLVRQSNGRAVAAWDGREIAYDPAALQVTAYGEHMGLCVEQEARLLADGLGIERSRVTVDRARSLPLTTYWSDVPVRYGRTTLPAAR